MFLTSNLRIKSSHYRKITLNYPLKSNNSIHYYIINKIIIINYLINLNHNINNPLINSNYNINKPILNISHYN